MWLIVFIFVGIVLVGVVVSLKAQDERGKAIDQVVATVVRQGFNITKRVNDSNNDLSLLIDEGNNKWAIINARTSLSNIFDYKDLIEYELIEDDESIVKGRVGSAIVGGVLLGGVGAIAGASRKKKIKTVCNSMSVKILVNSFNTPQYMFKILTCQSKTDSFLYKNALVKASEMTSLLAIIKSRAEI